MSTTDAGAVIVEKLTAAGIRATMDPGALNPPAVLVVPPRRTYDVACGYTALWGLRAIVPAPTGGDHTAWAQLDTLVDAIASVYPVETATPYGYPTGSQILPSYLVTFQEVCE
jgi:hypothetical protein